MQNAQRCLSVGCSVVRLSKNVFWDACIAVCVVRAGPLSAESKAEVRVHSDEDGKVESGQANQIYNGTAEFVNGSKGAGFQNTISAAQQVEEVNRDEGRPQNRCNGREERECVVCDCDEIRSLGVLRIGVDEEIRGEVELQQTEFVNLGYEICTHHKHNDLVACTRGEGSQRRGSQLHKAILK